LAVSVVLSAFYTRVATMTHKRDPRPYVGIHKEVLFGCPEWAALSPRAKCLYLLLKAKRNPAKNDGTVKLTYREILKIHYAGLLRQTRINEGFHELEEKDWIKRVDGGGLFGKATFYQLTGKYDEFGMKK
jgi:hypothetical protein